MGKRIKEKGFIKKKKNSQSEVTVDLGLQKAYLMETPEGSGIVIGKVHGIGKRSMQQDSFGVSELKEEVIKDKGIMAIVADGMGGLSDGERASMATIISCLNYFDTHDMTENMPDNMTDMAENANMEVREVLSDTDTSSGSTLVAAVVKDRKMHWVSVGDSHILLYRGGEIVQLNKEHNYAADLQDKVEAGEIPLEEALNDPQRNALTSYIGIACLEKIDCNQEALELFEGDRVLLISDGVYNTLDNEELAALMEYPAGKAMMQIGMQIEAKRKPNQDNYTAIMMEIC